MSQTTSTDLRVSVIQDTLSWHDPVGNRARYDMYLETLNTGDTDLIVLPEMFSTGFSMQPRDAYETMDGDTVAWMREGAKALDAVITGSLIMRLDENGKERFVNRMIWAQPDGGLQHYDKRHLFRYAGEHKHFEAGNKRVVVQHKGWRIALFVCYDLRFPVFSRNRDDYDLALYVANWPDARQFAWDSLLVARAIENQCYVVASNRLGNNPLGNSFSGGSVILDFMGQGLREFADEAVMHTQSLDKQAIEAFRKDFPASLDSDAFTLDLGAN